MKLNQQGIDLIKKFEGCYLKATRCPAGVWTIGYGHTGGVLPSHTLENEQAAMDLLMDDLDIVQNRLTHTLGKSILNENQYSALVSFVFNCGTNAFRRSTMYRCIKERKMKEAADALLMWNKATVNGEKIELKGLTRRRKAERELFLTPVENKHEQLDDVMQLLVLATKKLNKYIKEIEHENI